MIPLMDEIWVDIGGFEGSYQVSIIGRVRSLTRDCKRMGRNGKVHTVHKLGVVLTPKHRGAYLAVRLSRMGVATKMYTIHRLVAIAFLSNDLDHPQVNHIDEDKHNNHLENLEWCSRSYNQSYSKSIGCYLMTKGDKSFVVKNVRAFCRRHPEFNYCGFNRVKNGKQKTINGWEVAYQSSN